MRYRAALETALATGYDLLRDGCHHAPGLHQRPPLRSLRLFNAGRGAVFRQDLQVDAINIREHRLAGRDRGAWVADFIRTAAASWKSSTRAAGLAAPTRLTREHDLPLQYVIFSPNTATSNYREITKGRGNASFTME
jgi:beta-aspartyl-peptidase (threonine type)